MLRIRQEYHFDKMGITFLAFVTFVDAYILVPTPVSNLRVNLRSNWDQIIIDSKTANGVHDGAS